jgi:hypothetical protein
MDIPKEYQSLLPQNEAYPIGSETREIRLASPAPDPCNLYSLSRASIVTLKVYDILGCEVVSLIEAKRMVLIK